MLLKKFYILFLLSAFAVGSFAQQPAVVQEIESSGLIKINIPADLVSALEYNSAEAAVLTEKHEEAVPETPRVRVGYRVQVFDDNNVRTAKAQAQERKALIESRFPEFHGYVTFDSPYWRVKVGDFRTRSEAEAAMAKIRATFPAIASQLRVVRDKINSH